MPHARIVHGAASVALILLNGCATMDRAAGFTSVQALAAEYGIARVHWRQGTREDEEVVNSVRSMLADELTVGEAVQIALLNNRDLQSTYERLTIAQADLVQAGMLRNPVFDGSLRFATAGGDPVADLGIAFDFLDVFFIPLRKAVAEKEFEGAQLIVTGSVIDVAGKTRTTFYALQAAEQTLEMRHGSLAAYDAAYELARRIRAAGNSTRLRLANEQALYEEAKLAVVSAEEQAVTLRAELNGLMALFGDSGNWKLAPRLPEVPPEALDTVRLEADALERSLDLKIARGEIAVAAKKLGITKPLGVLSDLELGAAAELDSEGDWSVGPSLAIALPIFSQGQPAVAKADAHLRQAVNRYYSQAIAIRMAVRTAYARLQAARGRALHFKRVVLPLRTFIVEETQKEYNAMLIGAFELLQAKRDQIDAGRQYIEALRDYWVARSELEQIAAGRLVDEGLAPLSAATTPRVASTGENH